MLQKDAEDQWDQSCEKRKGIAQSEEGEEYPTYDEKKEG